jgi:lipoprotein-anchoring transpeptidase ErfK/SrfK
MGEKVRNYFSVGIVVVVVGLALGWVAAATNIGTYLQAAINGASAPLSQGGQVPTQPERDQPINIGVEANTFIVPEEGKAIRVDLGAMKLFAYEDGELLAEYEVIGKGKLGTYWETPGGEYRMAYRSRNHFSSTGKVWLPYSMQFFGNYFIHGWPHYSDGTPVSKGYSGGCIRLSVEDAREIFNWSERGTLIYVDAGESLGTQEGEYYKRASSPELIVEADSYLVGDIDTGQIIIAHNIDRGYPIGALTKLMNAMVELGIVNQQTQGLVSRSAILEAGGAERFSEGERILILDFVYPLILEQSNVAAEVVSRHIGRNYFIEEMNNKARAFQLESSRFVDPTGIDSGNSSTARDLFKFGINIKKYKNFLFELTKKPSYKSADRVWQNSNPFVGMENFEGGIVGDGSALVVFGLPVAGSETRNIAVVLLDSQDPEADVLKIVEYLQSSIYFTTSDE